MKTDLKLTIDQLRNYLGTELNIEWIDHYGDNKAHKSEICSLNNSGVIDLDSIEFGRVTLGFFDPIFYCRPLCYRLSDLDKFIPELGFVPLDEIDAIYQNDEHDESWIREAIEANHHWIKADTDNISFRVIQKLFQWHFWPFGDEYFEQGLVIDKLTAI